MRLSLRVFPMVFREPPLAFLFLDVFVSLFFGAYRLHNSINLLSSAVSNNPFSIVPVNFVGSGIYDSNLFVIAYVAIFNELTTQDIKGLSKYFLTFSASETVLQIIAKTFSDIPYSPF